jgi:hypothetical protein
MPAGIKSAQNVLTSSKRKYLNLSPHPLSFGPDAARSRHAAHALSFYEADKVIGLDEPYKDALGISTAMKLQFSGHRRAGTKDQMILV